MSAEPAVPASWRSFRMLAQIFVAFGQGAGQLGVSDDAVQAAVIDYADRIERGGDWGKAAPSVLGIAKVMGQAAAQYALRSERAIITSEDYSAARRLVHQGLSEEEVNRLLGDCPWF